eukprot:1158429-Pelagomonas_calceolata.AAC.1
MERLQIVKKRRCGRRCGEGRKLGSAWSCCWYKDGHTQFTTSIVSGNLGVLHRGQFGPAAKSWDDSLSYDAQGQLIAGLRVMSNSVHAAKNFYCLIVFWARAGFAPYHPAQALLHAILSDKDPGSCNYHHFGDGLNHKDPTRSFKR